jgi:hypothetical protein
MNGYEVVLAEFNNLDYVPDGALGFVAGSRQCLKSWVQIKANNVSKQLEGSSERETRQISMVAYSNIVPFIRPNCAVSVRGVIYGNLEINTVIDSKTKVKITAYL